VIVGVAVGPGVGNVKTGALVSVSHATAFSINCT
jgi:hypothetical protein